MIAASTCHLLRRPLFSPPPSHHPTSGLKSQDSLLISIMPENISKFVARKETGPGEDAIEAPFRALFPVMLSAAWGVLSCSCNDP